MRNYFILLIGSWAIIIIYLVFFFEDKPAKVIDGEGIKKVQTIDSLQNYADSLHTELYPCEIELNRFKVAFEIFSRRNPKAAEEYATIISEETE